MMKFYFIFIISIFGKIIFTENLRAQNYFPFPTDSARWKMTCVSGALGCPPLVAEFQDELKGDTIISSVTYHKIIRTGYTNNSFCYPESDGYAGAIREDGNKHIFLRKPNSNSDTLLYDFNLNIGDTLRSYANCCGPLIVSSIDSVLIQSSYRKRFILDPEISSGCFVQGLKIIEGIGSEKGLMECFSTFETGTILDCFSEHGNTIYPDTITNCPLLIAGISTKKPLTQFVTILPNPSNGIFYVAKNNLAGNSEIEIYNSLGEKISDIELKNEITEIDLSSEAKGIYFYRVMTDGKISSTGKLISE